MKQSKATRIRKLLLINADVSSIAKTIKCDKSYVYQVKKAMDAEMDAADYEFMTDKTIVRDYSDYEIEVIGSAKLSKRQAKIAKKLGIPLDVFAKAKVQLDRQEEAAKDTGVPMDMDAHSSGVQFDTGAVPRSEIAEWKARNDGTPFIGSKVKKMFKQEAVNFNKILDKEYAARDAAKKSVLDDAKDIIYGDREKTYGAPDKNLVAIAGYWSNHLLTRFGVFHDITGADVCVMMTLLKAARLGNNLTHRDSLVDAVGYLALLERIQKK